MRFRPRLLLAAIPPLVGGAVFTGLPVMTQASAQHYKIDCQSSALCTEVHDWRGTFEYYSGHDEPSALFYSTKPGSGNHMTYQLTLPTEPTTAPGADGSGGSWDFQLHPAFWFGMAMCDPNSYPEVRKDCHPDSDSNIVPLAKHAGTAFMEMQFYPPGWTAWPAGTSCDATHWCAAMTIDSLSEDPIHGTTQNPTCSDQVGIEYVNFAWITKNGVPNGPANPVDATLSTVSPGPNNFLMDQGDNVSVKIGDTASGLRIDLVDNTSHTSGFMVASSKNGFGGVAYQPSGTNCVAVPMDFHPMYSTSQPPTTFACGSNTCANQDGTRVPWAAHSYNVAFSDEIGHFDWCSNVVNELSAPGEPPGTSALGNCATWAKENPGLAENSDSDDTGCFNGNVSADYVAGGSNIPGCLGSNNGFDGASYAATRWPSSSSTTQSASTPTPIQFTAPLTGTGDSEAYDSVAFEADVPRITGLNVTDYLCSRSSGRHCLIPMANDDQNDSTATTGNAFYPTFGVNGCNYWEGNTATTPGAQYGWSGIDGTFNPIDPSQVWKLSYLAFGGGGAVIYRFNDMNKVAGAPVSC